MMCSNITDKSKSVIIIAKTNGTNMTSEKYDVDEEVLAMLECAYVLWALVIRTHKN